ncbi:MAG: EF-hand domain-containing protein [Terracidiphilus sp.]|nr:EF-hand domain-containing protein [Terracidiphilus sp.]
MSPLQYFDEDGSGSISYDEFLVGVRGELNPRRKALVDLVCPPSPSLCDYAVSMFPFVCVCVCVFPAFAENMIAPAFLPPCVFSYVPA